MAAWQNWWPFGEEEVVEDGVEKSEKEAIVALSELREAQKIKTLSKEEILNGEYKIVNFRGEKERVKFTNGSFYHKWTSYEEIRVRIVVFPDSITDLDNDGIEDAIIEFRTNYGGTGTWPSYALITKDGQARLFEGEIKFDLPFNLVGDREGIKDIAVESDKTLIIKFYIHGPGDPLYCPSVEIEKRSKLEGNTLKEISTK